MAIEKRELRSAAMEVRMNVVLLSYRCEFAVVEEPDCQGRTGQGGEFDLIAGADAVDVLVEAVMEQVIPVAAPWVGGANPYAAARVDARVGAPCHLAVAGQAKRSG